MTKGIISLVWKLWERNGSCRLKCWRVQKVIVIVHFSSNQLYNDRCVKSRGGSDWQRWGGFLCHERQWQPFCPPATNYGGVDDGQDGARGSKQVSCRQLQLFQSESLDSKYFQSIGRYVTGGTACWGKQDARSKPQPASQKRAEFPFIGIIIVEPPHVRPPFFSVGLPLGGRWHVWICSSSTTGLP